MKKQIVIIHGGTTFDTYEEYLKYLNSCELTLEKINKKDWKDGLGSKLPEFEVIYPKMPNAKNARYPEWKIWFEKLFPLLGDSVTLIGHSLGGIFLAKYLSENSFLRKIDSLHLIAAPYDTEVCKETLADFALCDKVGKLANLTKNIFFYQSKDDTAVPFADVEKIKKESQVLNQRLLMTEATFFRKTFLNLLKISKNSLAKHVSLECRNKSILPRSG